MTYNPGIPAPGTSPATGRGPIQQNFQLINTYIAQDHVALDGASNQALHKKVTLVAPIADPAPAGSEAVVYSKTVSGKSQLFFKNSPDAPFKLTGFAKGGDNNKQYADLPGGIRLQWGRSTNITAGQNVPINFPVPFKDPPLSIQLTINRPGDFTSATFVVNRDQVTKTKFEFQISGSGTTQSGLYWFAIGFTP